MTIILNVVFVLHIGTGHIMQRQSAFSYTIIIIIQVDALLLLHMSDPTLYTLSLTQIAPLHPPRITSVSNSYGFACLASFSTA